MAIREPYRRLPLWCKVIHWFILINLIVNCCYAGFMVFFVIGEHGGLPLFMSAREMPYETVALRRLYAIEAWTCFAGLGIYLALMVFLPRMADVEHELRL